MPTRRDFIAAGVAAAAGLNLGVAGQGAAFTMYGLIGRIDATPGQRETLAQILVDGAAGMPGCRSYVVALDTERPDSLWVTEVWESAELHAASLELPSVQEAIAKGRPLIAGFSARHVTNPVGGHGLTEG